MMHAERLVDSLEQIRDAIDWIIDHTKDLKRFEMLTENSTLQFAVERNFSIMGEAVNRIYKSNRKFIDAQSNIPWDDMRRMRNKLIHDYDDVDTYVIWTTIKSDLPDLRQQIAGLLADIENSK